jgi:amidase
MNRRSFLKYSAWAGAATSSIGPFGISQAAPSATTGSLPGSEAAKPRDFRWNEATMADLQAAMRSGKTTALELVRGYIGRIEAIDWSGPRINSVIEINPHAERIAATLDRERRDGHIRGPLHGIPILLKDAIATADRMETTAGSLALVGSKVPRDAGVARTLRAAGAILLGKANMSEWNAYRGWPTHGGWSGRAGIGLNPYATSFSTGDSSSGSAAAVAANLAAGAVGMETYGSIIMPASLCSVAALKTTIGLTSRSGVIPLSFTRDATGPMARTITDVATLLGGLVGVDPRDPATKASARHLRRDYTRFLDKDGLRGARIGVWREKHLWKDDRSAAVIEELLPVIHDLGAVVIDPVELPDWDTATGVHAEVMSMELRPGINRYLAGLSHTSIRSLSDVIAFNEEHADAELRWHSQNLLEGANGEPPLSDPYYRKVLRKSARLGREAFAAPMRRHRLDAIFAPTFVRSWLIDLLNGDPVKTGNGAAGPSNAAGYPHITVPAGYVGELPIGASFMARAWEEPKLLRYAYAFEQAVKARHAPKFLEGYGVKEFVPRVN